MPNSLNLTQSHSPGDEFKALTETLSGLLLRENMFRRAYVSESLPYFSKLPTEIQLKIVGHLRVYVEICLESSIAGDRLRDSSALLWRMLRRLGFSPSSDLFSYIKDTHVIEIYNLENVQVFRNLKFFETCSYTLEELFSRQWWEMFRRDDSITQKVFMYGVDFLNGLRRETIFPDFGTHLLEEIASPLQLKMNFDIECLSPLFASGRVAAVCAVESVELMNEPFKDLDRVRQQLDRYYGDVTDNVMA